jgi:folate-binding protein YgfZ
MASYDPGYRALREGAAWLDLPGRGHIRASGEDRARLLHALSTNHIAQLQTGEGCCAFFLNAQGRILADANILCFSEALLLDTEPETRQLLYEHVDRYIIADDVTLEDLTDGMAVIGLEGPEAVRVAAALNAPIPEVPYAHSAWGHRTVARLSSTGALGFRIFAPAGEREELIRELEAARAVAARPEAARTVRIELGKARYGEDVTDKHLVQETQLLHAVNFDKGCYLGQEIVERVRSRGLVHRLLMPLRLDTTEVPPPGARIEAGDREAGEITSAAFSPAEGGVVALGYVRREFIDLKTELAVGGVPVTLADKNPI